MNEISRLIADHLHIPALQNVERARKDCERTDALEAILYGIERMGELAPDEVAEVLRALERADRGECSVSLEQAREDAESQVKALERISHE